MFIFGLSYLVCSDSEQRLRIEDSYTEILLPKPIWPEKINSLHGLLCISDNDSSANYYSLEVPLK